MALDGARLEVLGVELQLPADWRERRPPREQACSRCGAQVAAEGDAREEVDCPTCEEVVRFEPRRSVVFTEPGVFGTPRRLHVWSEPRGPYHAPDTVAGRFLTQMGAGEAGFRDVRQVVDRPFRTEAGLGHVIEVEVSAAGGGRWGRSERRRLTYRVYVFTRERRTIRLFGLAPLRDDPAALRADRALFDRIARSVRELPE